MTPTYCSAFDYYRKRVIQDFNEVNGVGNRMALTILSGVSVGEFVRVVKNDQCNN